MAVWRGRDRQRSRPPLDAACPSGIFPESRRLWMNSRLDLSAWCATARDECPTTTCLTPRKPVATLQIEPDTVLADSALSLTLTLRWCQGCPCRVWRCSRPAPPPMPWPVPQPYRCRMCPQSRVHSILGIVWLVIIQYSASSTHTGGFVQERFERRDDVVIPQVAVVFEEAGPSYGSGMITVSASASPAKILLMLRTGLHPFPRSCLDSGRQR